jgi:hypothetical protein
MTLSVQRIEEMQMHPMNEGSLTPDVRNADGAPAAPRGVARGGHRTADDDGDGVLFDTRGQQINPLPTAMTVAEALEDTLGSRY